MTASGRHISRLTDLRDVEGPFADGEVPVFDEDAGKFLPAAGGGGGGAPSGPAGGVLSGSYPNPGFAVDMATQAELDAEAAARAAADATLTTAIAAKQDAATAATDAELTAAVDDLEAADAALQDAIDAETSARVAADAAKADLVGGVVPTSQIPAIATGQTVTVASQAAMLALTSAQVQPGDVAIRTDQSGRRWLLADGDPSVLASWIALEVPDAVSSVNGQQGAVVLGYADVGAASDGDARLSDQRTPSDGSVTAAKVAAALKPSGTAAAGDEALRALGTTSATACAGNDSRLSDQRTPSDGSVTNAKIAAAAAIAESKLDLASDAAAGTASRRTLGTGAQQAAAGDHTHSRPAAAITGTQSIAELSPGVLAKVALNSVTFDNMGWWNASLLRYIPQVAGLYLVTVSYNGGQAVPDQKLVDVAAAKNGSQDVRAFMRWVASGSSYGPCGGASGLIYMDGTTDYLEFFGGTNRVGGLTGNGYLGIALVS